MRRRCYPWGFMAGTVAVVLAAGLGVWYALTEAVIPWLMTRRLEP